MDYILPFAAEEIANRLGRVEDLSYDMTEINNKLDTITSLMDGFNRNMRIESGQLEVTEDAGTSTATYNVQINCSNGGKILLFQADNSIVGDDGYTTYDRITKHTTKNDGALWTIGVVGNCASQVGTKNDRGYIQRMEVYSMNGKDYWLPIDTGTTSYNTEGFSFNTFGIKKGLYNWTVIYWD